MAKIFDDVMKLSDLKANPKNPRITKDEKFKKLVKSLHEFPEMMAKRPMVCVTDVDGKLFPLGGNMRLKALQELKYKEIPDEWVMLADEWTEEQRNEFIIKDNVGFGEWDWDTLATDWDLEQLTDWGLDVPEWEEEAPEAVEDDYEIPDTIETDIVLGDLFEIGEHRLLCGDSTDSDQVTKLMNGEKADIGFTSPPYNSGNADFTYDYKAKKEGGFYKNYKDDLNKNEYYDFLISVLNNYLLSVNLESHSLFWNVMYNANSRDDYGKIIFSENQPFKVRETIIWNKINGFPIAGDNILSRNSELIFLLSNSKKYKTNQNNKTIYWNRWDISNQNSQDKENEHKACFPIGLPYKAIEEFSLKNNIILDLFLGSGTTMVAAHQLKRKCYGMELDCKYVQVIVDRMRKLDPNLVIKKNGVII